MGKGQLLPNEITPPDEESVVAKGKLAGIDSAEAAVNAEVNSILDHQPLDKREIALIYSLAEIDIEEDDCLEKSIAVIIIESDQQGLIDEWVQAINDKFHNGLNVRNKKQIIEQLRAILQQIKKELGACEDVFISDFPIELQLELDELLRWYNSLPKAKTRRLDRKLLDETVELIRSEETATSKDPILHYIERLKIFRKRCKISSKTGAVSFPIKDEDLTVLAKIPDSNKRRNRIADRVDIKFTTADERIQSIHAEIRPLKDLEMVVNAKKAEIVELRHKIEDLEAQLEKIKVKIVKANEEFMALVAMQSVKPGFDDLAAESAQKFVELEQLDQQRNELIGRKQQLEDKPNSAQNEIAALELQIEETAELHAQTQEEFNALVEKQRLTLKSSDIATMRSDKYAELEQLDQQKNELKGRKTQLGDLVQSYQDELDLLQPQVDKIPSLKAQIEQIEANKIEAEKSIQLIINTRLL